MDNVVAASGYNKEIKEFDAALEEQSELKEEIDNETEKNEHDSDDDESESKNNFEDEESERNSEDDETARVNDSDNGTQVSNKSETRSISNEDAGKEEADENEQSKPMDATFNATMAMYFQSMKEINIIPESLATSSLNCCPNAICTEECLHLDALTTHSTLSTIPEGEVHAHISSVNLEFAENMADEQTAVSSSDNFDARSTTSSRRSKSRNTGQKLDDETRKALTAKLLESRRVRKEAVEKGEPIPLVMEFLESSKHDDDRISHFSFSSYASTVDPATLKARALREVALKDAKQVSKKSLRAKGEANAYTRKKMENSLNIKQSMECRDVWD